MIRRGGGCNLKDSNCPTGHLNLQGQKFCGECGVSLISVCLEGHENPEDYRYCGTCGCPLAGSPDPLDAVNQNFLRIESRDRGPAGLTPDALSTSEDSGGLGIAGMGDLVDTSATQTRSAKVNEDPDKNIGEGSPAMPPVRKDLWSAGKAWLLPVAGFLFVAGVVVTVGLIGGDDTQVNSYLYGKQNYQGGLALWKIYRADPQIYVGLRSEADACRTFFQTKLEVGSDSVMRRELAGLDLNYVVSGCAHAIKYPGLA